MFADTLLESTPMARKRKRWPMATAFSVECILAAGIVLAPLLSTGVIPISARPQPAPREVYLEPPRVVPAKPGPSSGAAAPVAGRSVVPIVEHKGSIYIGPGRTRSQAEEPADLDLRPLTRGSISEIVGPPSGSRPAVKPSPVISRSMEALLLNRVDPVYPRIAAAAGVQGAVKLHAFISRDGRIMSLNVISGPALLVEAARDAVNQWRYRPYILNGEAVEVETFITVNFRKGSL